MCARARASCNVCVIVWVYEYVRVVGGVWCDTGERESARASESEGERARERKRERGRASPPVALSPPCPHMLLFPPGQHMSGPENRPGQAIRITCPGGEIGPDTCSPGGDLLLWRIQLPAAQDKQSA